MSIYACLNEESPAFFSSSSGWSDVIAWAESQSAAKYPALTHLIEHGYTEDLSELSQELESAKTVVTDENVQATLLELLEVVEGEEGVVAISNGMQRVGREKLSKTQEALTRKWKDYP